MADNRVKVLNIKHVDMRPKLKNPALNIFLPKYYFAQRLEFDIHNVSNAVSSAIRRTISTELLVKAMICKYEDIATTDIYIIPEMIIKRISTLPLDQSCPLDMTLELTAANHTATTRDVKSHEIRVVNGGKGNTLKHIPFNDNITLFTLQPGKTAKISNIRINQSYGYVSGDGMYVVAFNAVSIALDQAPNDMYDESSTQGVSSSMMNARQWRIRFNTNGIMPTTAIVAAACENIISRVTFVAGLLESINMKNDEHILNINGESSTIGNLFMRAICDLYPDIGAVTYSVADIERICTIHVRCNEDIEEVFRAAIAEIVSTFKTIGGYFKQ